MKNKIFAEHEAKHIVEADAGKIRKEAYEMDARGWPLKVRVDYEKRSLVTANYHLPGREMTYSLSSTNSD